MDKKNLKYLYPWLKGSYENIIKYYINKRHHHSIIFYNVKKNGTGILCIELTKWILCNEFDSNFRPCNKCYDCNLINKKMHPDLYIIRKNKKNSINIYEIKKIINIINYSSYRGKKIIILIKNIEFFTIKSMNAILKILEEPPKNIYFLIKCYNKELIIPTILSRCKILNLSVPSENSGLKWLIDAGVKCKESSCISALRLSLYAPYKAYLLINSKEWGERKIFYNLLYKIIINKKFQFTCNIFKIFKEENIVKWFLSFLIDLIKKKYNIENKFLTNLDILNLIYKSYNYYNLRFLIKNLDKWVLYKKKYSYDKDSLYIFQYFINFLIK
ncbi:MAG: DNA polymerase III subunit delta' C-terminal domain-containing protein [Enterobacteriaceae bacterium]